MERPLLLRVVDMPVAVFVMWEDTCGPPDTGWTQLTDVRQIPVRFTTLGWLVAQNDEAVTIAGTVQVSDDPITDQMTGILTIPQSAVLDLALLDFE